MIKIVSGGQTGVDRAALDAARETGIPYGGWCPKGRLAEDGVIPVGYDLKETPSEDYPQRTELNVRDSDATLIITIGEPVGGTAFTIECAQRLGRPCLAVDPGDSKAVQKILVWLKEGGFEVLNVAGPRESSMPGISENAAALLSEVIKKI